MGKARFRIESKRGGALVAALIVTVTIAALGAALVQMSTAVTRRDMQGVDTKRAFYVAEAGLSESFIALSQGKSGNVGTEDILAAVGEGLYWVEANDLGGGNIALTSTGLCGLGRFALTMVVQKQSNPIASLGIFGGDGLTVGEGSVIDGYDSSNGTFDTQADQTVAVPTTGSGALLNSNGDISLEGTQPVSTGTMSFSDLSTYTTRIYGDARPGQSGTVSIGPSVLITGATAPNSSDTGLPTIRVPEVASSGALVHDSATPLVVADSVTSFDSLTVQAGSKLVLEGPLALVVGTFRLDPRAELEIDSTDGPVAIFVTSELTFSAGSQLSNPSQDPKGVALFIGARETVPTTLPGTDGAATNSPVTPSPAPDRTARDTPATSSPAMDGTAASITVTIEASGDYYGFIYAPDTTLIIPSSLRIFGSVAAREITLAPGSRFSFDSAMAEAEATDAIIPSLISWRIVELPRADIVRLRFDPRRMLEMRGVPTPPSAEAHRENQVVLTYRDSSGAVQTVTGDPSTFDWSDVSVVISNDWVPRTELEFNTSMTNEAASNTGAFGPQTVNLGGGGIKISNSGPGNASDDGFGVGGISTLP